jgi:hypothetical protein
MARDKFHNTVKTALEKAGWRITDDPYRLKYGDVGYEIDLGAESVLGAEREGELIAVEIKSFLRESIPNEFHGALGQFLNYQFILEQTAPERRLYLAISQTVFESFFQLKFTREAVQKYQVRLLVFNPDTEEVVLWQ